MNESVRVYARGAVGGTSLALEPCSILQLLSACCMGPGPARDVPPADCQVMLDWKEFHSPALSLGSLTCQPLLPGWLWEMGERRCQGQLVGLWPRPCGWCSSDTWC